MAGGRDGGSTFPRSGRGIQKKARLTREYRLRLSQILVAETSGKHGEIHIQVKKGAEASANRSEECSGIMKHLKSPSGTEEPKSLP